MSIGVCLPYRVELYCMAVDLRCGQNGLLGLVENELKRDSMADVLYLFTNRSQNLIKGLYWDRTGYCVISKRLLRGKFSIAVGDKIIELEGRSLRLLLDGLNLFV